MIPAPWTMEQIDTVRRMWADGATLSQIGAAVNRSRSAVAGKVDRLELPKKTAAAIAALNAHNAAKRWEGRPHKPSKPFTFKKAHPKERKPPMFLRVVSVPDSKPVPLGERTGCCYPTTGEKPHLFCNEPLAHGDYCETHYWVMYPRGKAA